MKEFRNFVIVGLLIGAFAMFGPKSKPAAAKPVHQTDPARLAKITALLGTMQQEGLLVGTPACQDGWAGFCRMVVKRPMWEAIDLQTKSAMASIVIGWYEEQTGQRVLVFVHDHMSGKQLSTFNDKGQFIE